MDEHDPCDVAVNDFEHSAANFGDTLGGWVDDNGWIDGSPDNVTFGDVLATGVNAGSEWIQMDTTCNTDSF